MVLLLDFIGAERRLGLGCQNLAEEKHHDRVICSLAPQWPRSTRRVSHAWSLRVSVCAAHIGLLGCFLDLSARLERLLV